MVAGECRLWNGSPTGIGSIVCAASRTLFVSQSDLKTFQNELLSTTLFSNSSEQLCTRFLVEKECCDARLHQITRIVNFPRTILFAFVASSGSVVNFPRTILFAFVASSGSLFCCRSHHFIRIRILLMLHFNFMELLLSNFMHCISEMVY